MINKKNNTNIIEWLLEGEPWVKYITRIDLLGEQSKSAPLLSLKTEMIKHPKVQALLRDVNSWPGKPMSSHKSANQLFHKLSLLADFGLSKEDKEIDVVAKKIMSHESEEGLFTLRTNIPVHYGGTGKDTWAWSLCDAPLVLYSLLKFGYNSKEIQKGIEYIISLEKENGWPCKVSKELGSFRGPGRKDDPCPFATLASLKMLTQSSEYIDSNQAKVGVETLLNLWKNSRTLHPYIFYMGNDFRKLKAPLFWYEILNVADVLSQFKFIHNDKRFLDIINVIKSKQNNEGQYTPESVYREFKDYDFGQKKEPSRWITLNVIRILRRTNVT